MKPVTIILALAVVLLGGCSDETPKYPSAAGAVPPYILKQGCTFTIISEQGSAGVTSPQVSGDLDATASMSVTLGDMSIAVSDCKVVENSYNLPVYEN